MPPDPHEVLLRKAEQDARLAMKLVSDTSVPDEYLGFFCQQAVEKAIKSALSFKGIAYRRTHDIAELLEVLKTHFADLPNDLLRGVVLTPFAVEFRYDDLPPERDAPEPFDRSDAVTIAGVAVAWARDVVQKPD